MMTNIPMRWAYYLRAARFWGKLLQDVMSGAGSILEIGPGWSPKIILGLHTINFGGSYFALDQSHHALSQLQRYYDELRPQFTFTPILESMYSRQNDQYHVVVLNHVLDDLLLTHHLRSTPNSNTLEALFLSRQLYEDTWSEIDARRDEYISTIVPRVTEAIDALVLDDGIIVCAQYPAYQDQLYAFSAPASISAQLLARLRVALQRHYDDASSLSDHAWKDEETPPFTASECLILRKKSTRYPDLT